MDDEKWSNEPVMNAPKLTPIAEALEQLHKTADSVRAKASSLQDRLRPALLLSPEIERGAEKPDSPPRCEIQAQIEDIDNVLRTVERMLSITQQGLQI